MAAISIPAAPVSKTRPMTVASGLQLAGVVLLAAAVAALSSWPWAVLVFGVAAVVVGVAMELDERRHPREVE